MREATGRVVSGGLETRKGNPSRRVVDVTVVVAMGLLRAYPPYSTPENSVPIGRKRDRKKEGPSDVSDLIKLQSGTAQTMKSCTLSMTGSKAVGDSRLLGLEWGACGG